MGKKMSRAPIFYAFGQVRFNTLLALDQFVPAIQDRLRRATYSDFKKEWIASVVLQQAGGSIAPAVQNQVRYLFLNTANTHGFMLDQSMMAFQTTAYETFDPFLSEMIMGLRVLHEVAELNFSERIGIRYLDAICPVEGETLADYLSPSTLGLYDKFESRSLAHSFSETRTTAGKTTLIGRVIVRNQERGVVAFPEDLSQILTLDKRFSEIAGTYAIMDTDSWLEEREPFDVENLEKRLHLLHDDLDLSFDLMVTKHAIKRWE